MLHYFAEREDAEHRHKHDIQQVLSEIVRGNLLPPMQVLQVLSKSEHICLDTIEEFMSERLEYEEERIEDDEEEIAK